jgi:3-oxoacyl-ACP reductase-like protein
LGERRGAYRILMGKLEVKRPFGRARCRWEDNIKMDLQEVGCEGMDWIDLAQDSDRWQALADVVMNLRSP